MNKLDKKVVVEKKTLLKYLTAHSPLLKDKRKQNLETGFITNFIALDKWFCKGIGGDKGFQFTTLSQRIKVKLILVVSYTTAGFITFIVDSYLPSSTYA